MVLGQYDIPKYYTYMAIIKVKMVIFAVLYYELRIDRKEIQHSTSKNHNGLVNKYQNQKKCKFINFEY